jgi:cbb3-type cytochrome oxidase cytochrome c subunit
MSRSLFALAVVACITPAFAQEVRRSDLKPGLLFTSADKGGFSVTRLESGVGLTLLPGEAAHPRSDGGKSFTWTGYIQIVSAGKYQFDATLLGKLSVTVGDQTVLSGEKKDRAEPLTGAEVELKPGIQLFAVTLERTGPGVRVELNWSGPRFRREPIPYFFFGHTLKQRPATFADDVKREHGRFLFEELACVKCHAAGRDDKMTKGLAERGGPNLSKIAERAYPGWLDAWLAHPKKLRPHTAMPAMFSDDEKGKAERYAVVAYLTSLGKPLAEYKPPAINPNDVRQSLDRGAKLYLTAGCATCHGDQLTAPPTKKKKDDDEDDTPLDPAGTLYGVGTATGPQMYYTLNHVGSKTSPMALGSWLLNPLETNPHGRMPNMKLSVQEAFDIARHLCKVTDDKISPKMPEAPKIEPKDVVKDLKLHGAMIVDDKTELNKLGQTWPMAGWVVFHSKGCVNCHNVDDKAFIMPTFRPEHSINANALGHTPAGGCMADKPAISKVPNYALTADQKASLTAFLKDGLTGAGSPSAVHTAKVALKRFNCLNCHSRDGEGGIDAALADKMKALENPDNADDVQPPRLTGIGRKMRTSWMKEVLTNAGRARPWMTLRMPQYGDANVGKLHEHLPLLDGTTTDDAVGKAEFTKEKIETGKALAGKQGHGCISCHDISGLRGGGTRGPDLATTNQRVRFDWYTRWMHQPQRMVPGTKMPQAFIEGKALLDQYYGGDGDKQIEALWAYFSLGPGLPLPAGLEPPKGMVVAVKDRPELLRTFLPDNAGTKCVAVGYPGGLNVAFDSSQCRLSYAWSGNFLDVQPVWDGRGGNPARLLGQKFWAAPAGFPWAITASSDKLPDFARQADDPAFAAPLPSGKAYTGPMAVKFTGYTLDDQGQPTFRYSLSADDGKASLTVTETPLPSAATVANGLTRKFGVRTPAGKAVWLNVGVSAAQPKLVWAQGGDIPFAETVKNGDARVVLSAGGEAVQVVQADQGAWRFVKDGDRWRVYLLLDFGQAMNAEVNLRMWSLPKGEPALLKELK